MPTLPTLVELQSVHKAYGPDPILQDITLRLESGRFYALLGKNGVGKSTLMRLVMRLEPVDQGTGSILGASLDTDCANSSRQIGYVSETLDLPLPIAVQEYFDLYPKLYPTWDQVLFKTLIERLGLSLGKRFSELSRGQKMQLAFAQAFAIRPRIMLLDEITSVLDSTARIFFIERLEEFVRQGGTVLMATNIVSEVNLAATDVLLLHGSKLKLALPITEATSRFLKVKAKTKDLDPELAAITVLVSTNSDGSHSFLSPKKDFETYLNGRPMPSHLVDRRNVTLEDVFLFYTHEKQKERSPLVERDGRLPGRKTA